MKVFTLNIPVTGLAETVYSYGKYLRANFSRADLAVDGDADTAGGDIRLQVLDGPLPSWRVWQGDSSYDTDHRGFWGSAFVPYGCTRKESREIARALIDEAQESAAMAGE